MSNSNTKIAVIGMACRFPGANNLEEYWNNLLAGKEMLHHFTDEELENFEPDFENLRKNPAYVRVRGILSDIDKFDAGFFGMTPREAAETDPQQRIWLETVWDAFENAGCDPFSYKGAIGVFAGGYMSTYLLNNILRDPLKLENYIRLRSPESYQLMTSNDISFLSTKTAYKFNLRGPAMNVQTACSTSLVAISQACQSLYSYESDICLAGGVRITSPQESGYIYQEGSILSPDGRCRPFDAQAKGTVPSNGIGVVVLKRLEDALEDKDSIYAIVSGWALNNDGSNKVSYTAPSVDGQAAVIKMAQSFAERSPEEICYIETHGTATRLGDPIEIAALKKAFSAKTAKKQFCGVGSVKSNIGHTDAAAGVASFIKASLIAYNKKIPASLNFFEPNPHIDFENSPFYVQNEPKEWNEDRPLIMGVSSFGIGGTNAHVIIEEPPVPEKKARTTSEWPDLLLLSAKSEFSISRRKKDLIEFLRSKPLLNIGDVSFTLGSGRNNMAYRSFTMASSLEEITSENRRFADGKKSVTVSKIAFVFPGQGSQYLLMGSGLYKNNSTFRSILDRCFKILRDETGEDLKKILFDFEDKEIAEAKLSGTGITQPAIFIIEYALAKTLEDINVSPDCLIGHSIGEYTAACIAGVFDLPSALKIVIKRGQLMQKMPSGKMMAVKAGVERLQAILTPDFEIAADNSEESATISFKTEDEEKVKRLLDVNNISYLPLNTSHAFHSSAFDPILSEFRDFVNQFNLKSPALPFISCLTGNYITEKQAISGAYWAQQLRNTVHFREGVSVIAGNAGTVFLEVGPNTHLSGLIRQSMKVSNKALVISTLGKPDGSDERYKVIAALGNMFNAGMNINVGFINKDVKPSKIFLPTYPFERKRHWVNFKLSRSKVEGGLLMSQDSENCDPENGDAVLTMPSYRELPGDKIAMKVLSIWISLIGREEIGLDDDFLELGGHSLLALQVISRIKEVFNINIPLNRFFLKPTVNELVSIIKTESSVAPEKELFPVVTDLTCLPLSSDQKRMWTINQLNPFSPAYNIPFTYQLPGEPDLDVFNKSIELLFNRHNIMFSTFKTRDGKPYCEIVPGPVKIELIDYSGPGSGASRDRIFSFIGSESRKWFNIETGPLFRLYLLKGDDSAYYFHTTIHHLIFDGWSWGVFVRDFNKIYSCLSKNVDIELDPLNFHHYDYALWQESSANMPAEEKLSKFWINYLKDCPGSLDFPYDRVNKDTPTGYGEKVYLKIPAKYTAGLKGISKSENSTLFVTLVSAFGVLLSKYSGSNDICIGSPVGNRPQTRLENIFGMFVNTIALRLKIEQGLPFNKLVAETRNSVIDAISNQELPFEKVVEAVKPYRSFNTNPLFQVCFAWQNNLSIPMEVGGARGERITVDEGISPFNLTFYMWENGDLIEGEIEYNIDILDRDTIVRLRENFLTLIGKITEQPEVIVSSLPLLSENEKEKIISFTSTATGYPREKTIIGLFKDQVNLYPGKTAVVFRDESITYRDLDEKTNRLAHTLKKSGVSENTPVGIIAEKSIDIITGILGILKAGGGYVPVDPDYPLQRINFIIEDSGCSVILVQDKYSGIDIHGVRMLSLNADSSFSDDMAEVPLKSTPEDLAYIMYTSGTTGMPKGSMIHNMGVVRLVRNINYMELTHEDRILLTGAIVFDATTFEIWGALLNGGTLYIVEKETILNPKALGEELINNGITVLWLTSALFTQIAESRTDIFRKLKYLLSGGDVLSAQHINKVRRDNPALKVINGYGPTENTTFSTTYLIEKDFDNNIPIGKPISNSTAYIFDPYLNYQPIGVIGELYVGGDGLSMGYLKREDLNKTSFIYNPHNQGERLYKTGDRAKWLPDGNIEFHGRIDNQLKIRGFRVELDEIAAVLSEINGVVEAVIKPVKLQEGDLRLAAFLNVNETFSLDTIELTGIVKKKLPSFMVPSVFKLMRGFPSTINGKTDRNALYVDPDEMITRENREKRDLTPGEKIIYGIWCDALKTNEITPSDNFFDIGGNSLMAISVFSKIGSAFNVNLKLRVFFDSPRISDLARAIEIAVLSNSVKKEVDNSAGSEGIIDGEV